MYIVVSIFFSIIKLFSKFFRFSKYFNSVPWLEAMGYRDSLSCSLLGGAGSMGLGFRVKRLGLEVKGLWISYEFYLGSWSGCSTTHHMWYNRSFHVVSFAKAITICI